MSETLLGYSDVGLMGFELNLAAVTRCLAMCCTIPLLADADTGYGNAVNVYHTTRAFERAGGGSDDRGSDLAQALRHMQGKEVIAAEEMVEKIHAACDACCDPAFVVQARTDAFATHGLQEVLRRLTLYAEAGADLLFADALVSERDIATVARHCQTTLVNMGSIRTRATTPAHCTGALTGDRRRRGDLSAPAHRVRHPGDEARHSGVARRHAQPNGY